MQLSRQGRWFASWLASVQQSLAKLRRRFTVDLWRTLGRKDRRKPNFIPQMETLEVRMVPSSWLVNNTGGGNMSTGTYSGTLAYCVAGADGDSSAATITFDSSVFSSAKTITLCSTLNLTNSSWPITIDASGVVGPVTVSGNNSCQVFDVHSNVTATINDLTIVSGSTSGYGGGISNDGSLSVSGSTISGCEAAYNGGAIANTGVMTVSNSVLTSNSGGEIYNTGTFSLSSSTVSYGHYPGSGGGVINSGGTMTVTNSTISGNTITNNGSGFYNTGILTISGSAIVGNFTWTAGGGIYNTATCTLSNCVVSGNTASTSGGYGGGIYNDGTMTVSNFTIADNSANSNGGGIDNNGGTMTITDSTIADNSAPTGGGVIQSSGSLTLLNTIVATNTATTDPDVDGTVSGADNLIGDGTGMSGISNGDAYGNQVGTSGSPINPDLGPLQNNGGPTSTIALLPGSPAIGAGGAVTTLTTAISNTSITSVTVSSAAAIARTPGDYYILIDSEAMDVIGVSGNTLTVTRDVDGTTAATHGNGTAVYFLQDQRGQDRGVQDIGAYAYVGFGWQVANDPQGSLQAPIGEATVMPGTGSVSVAQPLDFDLNPGTSVGGNPALVYNSATVNDKPIIQLELPTDASRVASSIDLTLIWDPSGADLTTTATFDTTGSAGATYLLAEQVPSAVTASGEYSWELDAQINYSTGSPFDATFTGQAAVDAEGSSPFGAGWGISGIDQLMVTDGGVLRLTGTGQSLFYQQVGDSGSYTNPDDFGTLVSSGSGFIYTFNDETPGNTSPDELTEHFSPAGGSTTLFDLTSIVDSNNLTTYYDYNGSGDLTQVISLDGGTTSFEYSGALVTSIVEPGSRTVWLAYDASDNLTLLTDAAGNARTLSYDGSHHLTQDQWNPYDTSYIYDTAGLLHEINEGAGITYTLAPQAEQGLQTASALYASDDVAVVTDALGDATTYGVDTQGVETVAVTAKGGSPSWGIDGNEEVTLYVDENGLSTQYSYDSAGDMTEQIGPDGSTTLYTYNALQEATQEIDEPAGGVTQTTAYAYDADADLTMMYRCGPRKSPRPSEDTNAGLIDMDAVQAFADEFREQYKGKHNNVDRLDGFCVMMKREVFRRLHQQGELNKLTDLSVFDKGVLSAKVRQLGYTLAVCRDLFIHNFGTRTFAHGAPTNANGQVMAG